MNFMDWITNLDRRWLYLLVGVFAIVPLIFPLGMPVNVSPAVQSLYDHVEGMNPGEIIMVSMDYGPSTGPENDPMACALIRHALSRDLRIVMLALYPIGGVNEGIQELQRCVGDLDPPNGVLESTKFPGKIYGKDFVYLGYKDGGLATMRQMNENIHEVFPSDYWQTPVTEYELSNEVQGYDDVNFAFSVATGIIGEWWANTVNAQFGLPVAVGCTAVSAPKYFAYYNAGQMFALLGGLKGAAEYERLVLDNYPQAKADTEEQVFYAAKGWDVQSVVYSIITIFIILGNVAYLLERRRTRMQL
ncbi:MAG: hypothetical protein GY835_26130 [bacterium]|nr:hypothetical protein [bacterium]